MRKQIGIIGLGKMGMQIARVLHKKRYKVVAWNRSSGPREAFRRFGGAVSGTIPDMLQSSTGSKIVWVMLPAGQTTEEMMNELYQLLKKGDTVIDGGNSFYKDTQRRAKRFARKGIHYFDAGTSGGIWGERNGFSIMVGGPKKAWPKIKPFIADLAAGDSYGLVGDSGAGHFVKMVHNGIEYGMMEAIAEGLSVIEKWDKRVDLSQVAKIWSKGSVVSSWLIDLTYDALKKEDLSKVVGYVKHTGEGEWTVKTAKELGIDVRVIKASLDVRRESERKSNQRQLRNKLLALMRNRFGGHEVKRIK